MRCRGVLAAAAVVAMVAVGGGQAAAETGRSPRAVVVGLDGLDHNFIRNTSNLRFMPNLARILRDGNTRLLESTPTEPILSPIIWTSMVTGGSPTRHGILDFFSYDGGVALPVSTVDRKLPAIWNILSANEISSLCVGPFISYPAEKTRGVYLADDAFVRSVRDRTSIHPADRAAELGDEIARLLAAPGDWTELVGGFADDQLAFNVARVFAITRAKLELFVEMLAARRDGLSWVYVEGTDEIGHFLSHLWPTPISPDEAELAASVAGAVPAYFALVDDYLGRIFDACRRDGTYFIIVSDHGFKWQKSRPASKPFESEHAASWHSKRGVFLIHHTSLSFAAVRTDATTIYDLFPTLIDIFGLRHAPYEVGHSLLVGSRGPTEDYSQTVSVEFAGARQARDPELVRRLAALGYVRQGSNLNESRPFNNLGIIRRDEGDSAGAIRAFERAIEAAPSNPNPYYNLSMLYFANHEWDPFVDRFVRAVNLGLADGPLAIARAVDSLVAMDQAGVLERLLTADLHVDPEVLNPHFFELARHAYDDDPAASLAWLERIRTPAPDCRVLFLAATCRLRLGRPEHEILEPLRAADCRRELEVLAQ